MILKKFLLLIPCFLILSCGNSKYSKVTILSSVNDQPNQTRTLDGNFAKSKVGDMGWIDIIDPENRFKVSYNMENDSEISMLNVKIMNGEPIEWRKNKGHEIFYLEKQDSLIFKFGDRNSVAGSVKGSIVFIK